MELVGLAGKMGAGKDFVFKRLSDLGYRVVRESFADGLRYEIEDTIGEGMHLPALWHKPYTPEVRRLMQWWGTDFRRKEDPNYWLWKLDTRLEAYADENLLVCVTDIRFPNEAEIIKQRGGIIASVWAPAALRAFRLGVPMGELEERDRHPSERSMDNYPAEVILVSEHGSFYPQKGGDVWADLLARTPRRDPTTRHSDDAYY